MYSIHIKKTKIIYKNKVGMFFGDKCLKNNTGLRNHFNHLQLGIINIVDAVNSTISTNMV